MLRSMLYIVVRVLVGKPFDVIEKFSIARIIKVDIVSFI
jgi:hypothetical protein